MICCSKRPLDFIYVNGLTNLHTSLQCDYRLHIDNIFKLFAALKIQHK
jgi:hypothetical protein